jgi:hypothetical protein
MKLLRFIIRLIKKYLDYKNLRKHDREIYYKQLRNRINNQHKFL